jgi:hypothetical protein
MSLIASSGDEKIRGRAFGFHRSMDHTGAVFGPVVAIITLLVLFSLFSLKDPLEAMRLDIYCGDLYRVSLQFSS